MLSKDPLFGRHWRLAGKESRFGAGFKPSEESRHYEQVDGGYKLTVRGVHNGRKYEWHYTALYDDQPHPVHGRDDVDAIVAYRIDEHNTVGYFFKGGQHIGFYARSTNGNDLVVQSGGLQKDGSPYFDVIAYHA